MLRNILVVFFIFGINSVLLCNTGILIHESDSIYIETVKNIKFSNDSKYFVINPRNTTNRINIFNSNGEIFKSYHIDDSFTKKYIDSIYFGDKSELVSADEFNNTLNNKSGIAFQNNISKSVFISDSVIATIGSLNYLIKDPIKGHGYYTKKRAEVIFIINFLVDSIEIKFLEPRLPNLFPYALELDYVNEFLYFPLNPSTYRRGIQDSARYTLASISLNSSGWSPIAELPKEYHDTGIKLNINFDYKVNSYSKHTYFMAPFSNYLFNDVQDTIWLSDLNSPIKYSLMLHNSETIDIKKERHMLDSIPHFIIDFFFQDNNLYTIISIPKDKNKNIYLHKYDLQGNLIEKREIHSGPNSAYFSFSNLDKKLYKVYLENEKWYYEEINIY